jgi:hypothetical protein
MIATAIKEHVDVTKKKPDQEIDRKRLIKFIPAGRPPSTCSASIIGLLAQANDWTLQFD